MFKHYFRTILLLFIILTFNKGVDYNTDNGQTSISSATKSLNSINVLKTVGSIYIDDFDLIKSVEEKESSENSFTTFRFKNTVIKKAAFGEQTFLDLFTLKKKRYYILYCQLKTHL